VTTCCQKNESTLLSLGTENESNSSEQNEIICRVLMSLLLDDIPRSYYNIDGENQFNDSPVFMLSLNEIYSIHIDKPI
jgi:hypothetical protein